MTAAPPAPEDEPIAPWLPRLVERADRLAGKVASLQRDFDGAHVLAHDAQVREALTRSDLTLALMESLSVRADLERRLQAAALKAYRLAARERPLRRRNRPVRLMERTLARLGPTGQARVIASSGVWRDGGHAEMQRYAARGADPANPANALFDQAWHLERYPDLAGRRVAPLVHYLIAGHLEHRDPHPLFDQRDYAARHAHELAATGLSGLEHYVRVGAARGASPHPLFDVGYYLAQAPDLAPREDVLSHYLRAGAAAGLSPHPLFHPAWYAAQVSKAEAADGLVHYLRAGWRRGLSPHPVFETAWVLEQRPDLAEAGLEPLSHYVHLGLAAGFEPSPWFVTALYVAQRGEALPEGVNPLVDYLSGGAWAVGEVRPGHPAAAYVAARPDLVGEGITPLEHWGRRPKP